MQHTSDCATNNGPALPVGACDCGSITPTLPAVRIRDITAITDRLIERSSKFAAFFSRAELEAHVAFAMAPHYEAQTNMRIVD